MSKVSPQVIMFWYFPASTHQMNDSSERAINLLTTPESNELAISRLITCWGICWVGAGTHLKCAGHQSLKTAAKHSRCIIELKLSLREMKGKNLSYMY